MFPAQPHWRPPKGVDTVCSNAFENNSPLESSEITPHATSHSVQRENVLEEVGISKLLVHLGNGHSIVAAPAMELAVRIRLTDAQTQVEV